VPDELTPLPRFVFCSDADAFAAPILRFQRRGASGFSSQQKMVEMRQMVMYS
jgi:hypothetical protein